MKNRRLQLGCFMICVSILLAISKTQQGLLLVLKYVGLACGVSLLAHACLRTYVHRSNQVLALLGYAIIICYILLTIDTFVVHAISWFPGMIRYPIYSLYGYCYIVFIIPGWLTCLKQK